MQKCSIFIVSINIIFLLFFYYYFIIPKIVAHAQMGNTRYLQTQQTLVLMNIGQKLSSGTQTYMYVYTTILKVPSNPLNVLAQMHQGDYLSFNNFIKGILYQWFTSLMVHLK